ncbi:MAG: hypothetical protein A3H44_04710 [Gammaproteobacteria bacterium RIFCSPLOWO2_02_FULL_57_10]|nr:MAG: hypothetical protein A3H44_04710 [Gammaproteobacteria bacterium RIFCSPLOWO2_02_FULL_57_10]
MALLQLWDYRLLRNSFGVIVLFTRKTWEPAMSAALTLEQVLFRLQPPAVKVTTLSQYRREVPPAIVTRLW